jgi:hypothetical protein
MGFDTETTSHYSFLILLELLLYIIYVLGNLEKTVASLRIVVAIPAMHTFKLPINISNSLSHPGVQCRSLNGLKSQDALVFYPDARNSLARV